jgi:tetratricopeptide (TPR) repeat protein
VTTEHFSLRTDLPEQCASAAATEFEQTYASLRELAFPYDVEPSGRVTVFVFARDEDFRALGAHAALGGFMTAGGGPWDEPLMAATSFTDIERVRATFRHELTHRFVGFYYAQAPTWLNEGLAEHWETLAIADGSATIGIPSYHRVFSPTRWELSVPAEPGGTPNGAAMHRIVLQADALPTLTELRRATAKTFYGLDRNIDRERATQRLRHYVGAAAMVTWLRTGPYAKQFALYLHRLGQARSDDDAWNAAFRGVDAGTLQAAFRKALDTHANPGLRTSYEYPEIAPHTQRLMSDAEVHLSWIKVRRARGTRKQQRDNEADVRAALASAPNDPEVWFARAANSLFTGRITASVADIERALAARPEETRFLEGLFFLRYLEDVRLTQPPRWDRVEALAARLRRAPQAAWPTLNAAAWLYALREQPDAGLEMSKESIRREPGCSECYDTLAALLYQSGDIEAALGSQQRALGLAREGRISRGELERLRLYESAVAGRIAAERNGTAWERPPLRLRPYAAEVESPEVGGRSENPN